MAKRKITPERRAQRKQLLELLQGAGITDVAGVQELFKEMVSTVLENGLEGELDDELGYSRYDYRNKETDNSRNGYSEKTLKTSFGDVELAVPRDRKGEFERCAGHVGWRKRECEVLAERAKWAKKPWGQGHPDRLRRWPDRLSGGH